MKEFAGKVAVVTGGGSGIGSGMCRAFASAGMRVAIADLNLDTAGEIATQIRDTGQEAQAFRVDVADRASVEALAAAIADHFGGMDLVCNNAGVLVGGPMMEITGDDWQWLLSVNVLGVVHGSQIFGRRLIEQGSGHIVNTASIGGFLSFPDLATYCTSKFAVVGYTEALRLELAPHGIGTSTLCPGQVRTNLSKADRHRPDHLADAGGTSKALGPLADGMDPLQVGEIVLRGVAADADFIFTHAEFRSMFEQWFQRVLAGFDATPT
jgi:NAD(P)-dependent dehydrogenase (short-subunit alcohol dehydrogenase family)